MDSMPWVGWGCLLSDLDNDGWPDAFVTNGHTDNNYHLIGRTDVGLGPHGALALSIGGQAFSADLALQAGSELFVQGGVRFPLRAALSLSGRYRRLTLSVAGRAGADLSPGRFFRARAEAMLLVGWFGPW